VAESPFRCAWCTLQVLACMALAACSGVRSPGSSHAPAQIENSLGMRFVLLPAGTFVMGSDESVQRLARAYPLYARPSFRNWNTAQTRYTLVGMRLVRELTHDQQ